MNIIEYLKTVNLKKIWNHVTSEIRSKYLRKVMKWKFSSKIQPPDKLWAAVLVYAHLTAWILEESLHFKNFLEISAPHANSKTNNNYK